MPYTGGISAFPEPQNRAARRRKTHHPVGFREPRDFMAAQKAVTTQRRKKGKKR
jgi:hypothetical protein